MAYQFKTIPVNRGKYKQYPNYIKVSAVDYPKLSKYKWNLNPKGYAFTSDGTGLGAPNKPVFAHQYISRRAEKGIGFYTDATGSRKLEVDHINRQRNDDRRENLRQVTKAENLANRGVSRNKLSTGYRNATTNKINDLLSRADERSVLAQQSDFDFIKKTANRVKNLAKKKANNAVNKAKYYAKNKAKAKASTQSYRQKLKKDPKKYAAYRAKANVAAAKFRAKKKASSTAIVKG